MNIQSNINLLPYNTFHFSCIADYFVSIQSPQDRQKLVKTEIFATNKKLILGGGSNILLTQDKFHGLVIKNEILAKEILQESTEQVTIQVGAGENWNDFVLRTLAQGYCGLENLVSIPGTVGAAPMQNIGAYGVEAGDLITQITYLDLDGNIYTINKEACKFGYRESVFKHELKEKICITHITFQLKKYHPSNYNPNMKYGAIEQKVLEILHEQSTNGQSSINNLTSPNLIAQAVADIRASKLPDRTVIGTAGSFFKNPIVPELQYLSLKENFPDLVGHVSSGIPAPIMSELNLESGIMYKLSAGQLIDLSGLKGLDRGSVGTYHHHALILIHKGGGTGKDIVKLCHYIQQQVFEKFQVLIEPEVNFID